MNTNIDPTLKYMHTHSYPAYMPASHAFTLDISVIRCSDKPSGCICIQVFALLHTSVRTTQVTTQRSVESEN